MALLGNGLSSVLDPLVSGTSSTLTPAQQMAMLTSGPASIGQPASAQSGSTPYSQAQQIANGLLMSGGIPGAESALPTLDGTSAPTTTSPDAQNPIDYSQLLPSASQYESFAPLPYQSFGATPQISAATVDPASVNGTPNMQAASVNNSQLPGELQQYEGAVNSALSPTFQQQDQQLTANEADRGIFNSTAGQQLQNDLSGQQASALSSAYEPLIGQIGSEYNSNAQLNANNQQSANSTNYSGQLSNNQLLANLQQQAGLSNQTADNQSNVYNADAYGAVTGSNQSAYNSYLNTLMGNQTNLSNSLLGSALSTYDPSIYSSLVNTGLNNEGTAASNASNSAMNNSGALSSALGSLGSSLFSSGAAAGAAGGGGADMAAASFGGF